MEIDDGMPLHRVSLHAHVKHGPRKLSIKQEELSLQKVARLNVHVPPHQRLPVGEGLSVLVLSKEGNQTNLPVGSCLSLPLLRRDEVWLPLDVVRKATLADCEVLSVVLLCERHNLEVVEFTASVAVAEEIGHSFFAQYELVEVKRGRRQSLCLQEDSRINLLALPLLRGLLLRHQGLGLVHLHDGEGFVRDCPYCSSLLGL